MRSSSALVATVVPILTARCVRRKRFTARAAEQVGDAGERRVRIGLRILREQLMGDQAPVRRLRDDVGECAATVDEELPSAAAVHPMRFNPAA